ncbi:MAG: alanine racemase [Alphaproteobacteria bacterium]
MPSIEPAAEPAGGVLTIDCGAVAANYRQLRTQLGQARCGAVVKADAYGLGMGEIAPALAAAGCEDFFVALIEEGVKLRALLAQAKIYVFNGADGGGADALLEHGLIPALNDPGQIAAYARAAGATGTSAPAVLNIDTGMTRLGLGPGDIEALVAAPERLRGIDVGYVMTHLACASEPDHPLNRDQLSAFARARRQLKGVCDAPATLANSAAIFLGPEYHFDLARPGAALYGLVPHPGRPNPMAQVVQLQGRILQVRDVDSPMTVGYGATHRVRSKGRIATVSVGYADGYGHGLSNRGSAYIGDIRVPVVGRVSMDLITLDVSDVPMDRATPGAFVELIGEHLSLDAVADAAGTIGYEVLTRLGHRLHRVYVGGAD